ncbi:MAG: PEGA domain-containing protein [Kiritimatiellia bacterium]
MTKRHSAAVMVLALASFLNAFFCAAQEAPVRDDFDHILYLTIESEPSGAKVYALPEEGKKVGEAIGVTPCQTMVGLKWIRTAGVRRWKQLSIWAPGDVCYALMDTEKTWDIFVSCSAVLPDCKPKIVNEKILSLPAPGLNWDEMENWPKHLTLKLNLTQSIKERAAERKARASAIVESVLMASGRSADPATLGTVNVTASAGGASVQVDSKPAGRAPVSVKLPAGPHVISVFKDGWTPFTAKVDVTASSVIPIHAEMKPRSP